MNEEERDNKQEVCVRQKLYALWFLKKKRIIMSKSEVEVNNSWKESKTVLQFKHKKSKKEIEPEADLANVVYELSSNGKKTSLTTKLPERWYFLKKTIMLRQQ